MQRKRMGCDGAATLQGRAHEQQGLCLVSKAEETANALGGRVSDGEGERKWEVVRGSLETAFRPGRNRSRSEITSATGSSMEIAISSPVISRVLTVTANAGIRPNAHPDSARTVINPPPSPPSTSEPKPVQDC